MELNIIDESGDKKYFTQLPHYILNHSTANDQALYCQMKRFAGENGKCFATQETLMKKLGIGIKAYNKSLKYLLDKKWIKFVGKTAGKTRPINTYAIVDIWRLNILNYEKIPAESTISFKEDTSPKEKDTSPKNNKIPAESTVEEEQVKEEHNNKIGLAEKPTVRKATSFLKSDYERVIKKYEELKGVQFNGNEYLPIQQAIKSMFISKRSAEDIIRCMEWFMEKAKSGDKKYVWTENWTINTIKIKLAEFLAGKLESGSNEELIIPSYARDWKK